LVDDDEKDAVFVRDLLEASGDVTSGWEVEWRTTTEEGLEALRSRSFHACLVDDRFSRGEGLRMIRAARDENNPVPIILLAAAGDREADMAAMRAGAADFLLKEGLEPARLERAIRYAVAQARARSGLLRLARRDPLTGLHNRGGIEERAESARARAERGQRMMGLCLVDLDGFKSVNDGLGHAVGDQLLQLVGRRLVHAVRPYDTVGRLGGDEFVVVLEDIDSEGEAEQIAHRLAAAVQPPFELSVSLPPVSASVGLAIYPRCGDSAGALLEVADAAMYTAKRSGKARAAVYAEPVDRDGALLRTPADVQEAARSGALDVAFQPQVDLTTGDLRGVEALARWRPAARSSPDMGRVVAELERTGAIIELDLWVLRRAIERLASIGPELRRIAINLSPVTLASPSFLGRISRHLPSVPGRLELELTGSAVLREAYPVSDALHVLRALGFRIALDDFGLGDSSWLRVKHLPVDTLKVDRAFTSALTGRNAAIIEAMVTLGERAGLEVVAEGIETAQQLGRLRELGIRLGQGFYCGRPVELSDLAEWMAAPRAR
jgi:diguanylate cyclase (GGDEF)-like protein